VNAPDGRYVYMRGPADATNQPLCNYTLMPTRMNAMFSAHEMQQMILAEPFTFTKGCRTLKIPRPPGLANPTHQQTLLFDVVNDPAQKTPLHDSTIERRMAEQLVALMHQCD